MRSRQIPIYFNCALIVVDLKKYNYEMNQINIAKNITITAQQY